MQREIEEAVDQYGETASQSSERNSTPKIIARFCPLQSLIKKEHYKTERQHATNNAGVGKNLQIIVVRLFQTKQTVARIIFRVDNSERAEAGADVRIRSDYVECD